MNGRTYVLILFFWAVLTIVTPILVHLSASEKPNWDFNGFADEKCEGMKPSRTMGLLKRRTLVSTMPPKEPPTPPPAPAPEPEPHHGLCSTSELARQQTRI